MVILYVKSIKLIKIVHRKIWAKKFKHNEKKNFCNYLIFLMTRPIFINCLLLSNKSGIKFIFLFKQFHFTPTFKHFMTIIKWIKFIGVCFHVKNNITKTRGLKTWNWIWNWSGTWNTEPWTLQKGKLPIYFSNFPSKCHSIYLFLINHF